MSIVTKLCYIATILVLYLMGYTTVQGLVQVGQFDFYTSADSLLPLIPEFVWVYHSIVPVMFITMVGIVKDRQLFFNMFWACFTAAVVLNISYILLPAFYPRQAFEVQTLSGYILEITRQMDGAQNTFPSGHVTFSWLILFAASEALATRRVRLIYFLWTLAVTLSTLVLKQHYIVDVFSGILLAYGVFYLVKRLMSARSSLFTSDDAPNAKGW